MPKPYESIYLDEKLLSKQSIPNLLPFFHSCDAFSFRSILLSKKILPTKCAVFKNEKLLYLFYGRPAYKSGILKSSGLSSLLPVSFIIKSDAVNLIKRIAPFDTGAFKCDLFKRHLHPKMKVNQFLLTPEKRAIAKTIGYFFHDNAHYFSGTPKSDVELDKMEFELESYYLIISDKTISKADDRKSTIEVQLTKEIELTESTIEAIILPECLLSCPIIEDIICNEIKAKLIPYESYCIPSIGYYSEILRSTKKYLQEKDYLYVNSPLV